MKNIILCADDYGQNESISQAIIALVEKGRLSATSCMTTMPHWPTAAAALLPYQSKIDIGLHFHLTEAHSLGQILLKSFLRQLNQKKIEEALHHQIDLFVQQMGRLPTFLDGHQHVHQLPIVRDAVIVVYEQRLREVNAYIRCVDQPRDCVRMGARALLKRWVIQMMGSRTFRRALESRRIPHNKTFDGLYTFSQSIEFKDIFKDILQRVESNTLVMCHPGIEDRIDGGDKIASARAREYQFLASELFVQACEANNVQLSRFV